LSKVCNVPISQPLSSNGWLIGTFYDYWLL
jgi:hypothetical protein